MVLFLFGCGFVYNDNAKGGFFVDEHHLSQRLQLVASFVNAGSRIADIGADHAYLAASLIVNNVAEYAVAGEVARGPFENAVAEVKRQGLTGRVIPRLADGLAAINDSDRVDTVIIAGMGGSLIRKILDQGQARLATIQRLILQPNIGAANLRRWLADHRFQINHEQLVEEDGHIYEVIVADPVAMPVVYNERELIFGPLLLEQAGPVFRDKWLGELQRDERTIQQLQKAKQSPVEREAKFKHRIDLIKGVLG